jgi:xanthine dehydrogenase YagR molybdenum-binding subunit
MPTPVIGKPVDRVDGRLKVTGAARYSADVAVPNLAHAALVQSDVAAGRIAEIDSAAAENAPGVLAVLTRANCPPMQMPKPDFATGGIFGETRLPLSDDVIHHAGQTVAVVVADSPERARHAATLVRVRYSETRPMVVMDESAPAWSEPSEHFGEELQYARGDVEAALREAPDGGVILRETYTTPAETHNPMEPCALTAVWKGDRLTVYDTTQWIVGVQAVMAEAFGIPRENVHVISPFVGGAFGCKAFIWPHQLLAVAAAKAVGRPVKLVLTRAQMFTGCGHRPPSVQKMALAAEKDGRLTALKHESLGHTSTVGDYVEATGLTTSRMLYACPNVATPHRIQKMNVPTPTFMRAPGETPGLFALESAMDELAVKLGIDPIELRLRNFAETSPNHNLPWSSNHLKTCYRVGAEAFGWKSRKPEPRATRDGRFLVGWGMATATFAAFRWFAAAKIRMTAEGRAIVSSATHDLGTGAYTVFTQVAADALGLPPEKVTFLLGDSTLPPSPVAGGSNSTSTVSAAIMAAADQFKERIIALAVADKSSPLAGADASKVRAEDGRVFLEGEPAKGERYTDVIARSGKPDLEVTASSAPGEEAGNYAFQSWGTHFCEVRVDEELARVRVSRFVTVMDVGRVLNPKTARSQIVGAITMGIGQALMEETVFDERTGRVVTDNLADYAVPVCADMPAMDVHFINEPDPHINPLGCRGVGEIGMAGVAGAIANAVYHATGRRVRHLPITAEKLLTA